MDWKELAPKVKFAAFGSRTDMKTEFPGFSVWDWGTGRYAMILGGMETDIDQGSILVADYEYEYSKQMQVPMDVGGMRRGLTFCILKHERLNLPRVNLRNEAPVQKVFKRVIGKHDIYFAEDPEFSDRFEVQGPELEVHKLMTPELRKYFMQFFEYSPLRLEMSGNSILLHFGRMVHPSDSHLLIYTAVSIANFLMEGIVKYEIPSEMIFKDQV